MNFSEIMAGPPLLRTLDDSFPYFTEVPDLKNIILFFNFFQTVIFLFICLYLHFNVSRMFYCMICMHFSNLHLSNYSNLL